MATGGCNHSVFQNKKQCKEAGTPESRQCFYPSAKPSICSRCLLEFSVVDLHFLVTGSFESLSSQWKRVSIRCIGNIRGLGVSVSGFFGSRFGFSTFRGRLGEVQGLAGHVCLLKPRSSTPPVVRPYSQWFANPTKKRKLPRSRL
jgi:hypothetical protein